MRFYSSETRTLFEFLLNVTKFKDQTKFKKNSKNADFYERMINSTG